MILLGSTSLSLRGVLDVGVGLDLVCVAVPGLSLLMGMSRVGGVDRLGGVTWLGGVARPGDDVTGSRFGEAGL